MIYLNLTNENAEALLTMALRQVLQMPECIFTSYIISAIMENLHTLPTSTITSLIDTLKVYITDKRVSSLFVNLFNSLIDYRHIRQNIEDAQSYKEFKEEMEA